jgi:hypothetical protein
MSHHVKIRITNKPSGWEGFDLILETQLFGQIEPGVTIYAVRAGNKPDKFLHLGADPNPVL